MADCETVGLELRRTTCWCGTPFMIPSNLLKSALDSQHEIYCPHGHKMLWKETEADRQRRRAERAEQEQARLLEQLYETEKREARLKKRVSAGVCPCCNRTFSNMGRHMKTKHPNYNVVSIKKAG